MSDKKVSILGCGWLGLPLGEKLLKKGYSVKGSTTTKEKLNTLKEKEIEPFLVELNPNVIAENIEEFLESEILIIDIPPKRNENVLELFPAQINSILDEIKKSPVEKMIFISSTSVYESNNEEVDEETELNPERDSGKALVVAEGLLRAEITFETTIIRFGGLIGPDRQPGKFLSGRKNVSGGNSKVNLIHLDDCIEIIVQVVEHDIWGEIFNACADEHPTRKELYTKAAEKLKIELPEFSDKEEKYKIVSSEKLKNMLDYKFIYPDPLKMF